MHRMLIVALVATLLVAAPAPAAMTEARPDRKSDVMLYVVAPKLAGRAHVETRIGTGQDWSDECLVGADCGPALPAPTFLKVGVGRDGPQSVPTSHSSDQSWPVPIRVSTCARPASLGATT